MIPRSANECAARGERPMVRYVILWLLVLAVITGSLAFFFGPIALLYVAAVLFICCAIVWLLQ